MASPARIVDGLMADCGKSSPEIRARIERKVGEIALEMLSQNEGRFYALAKNQEISIRAGTTREYLLDTDFFCTKPEFDIYDEDGDFLRVGYILSKAEIRDRRRADAPLGSNICYIEYQKDGVSGRGWYLILATNPTENMTYDFEFYREPTEKDVSAIKDIGMLKSGVRAGLPDLFEETAEVDAHKYLSRLEGFHEKISRTIPTVIMTPNVRNAAKNRHDHKIGRGL